MLRWGKRKHDDAWRVYDGPEGSLPGRSEDVGHWLTLEQGGTFVDGTTFGDIWGRFLHHLPAHFPRLAAWVTGEVA